MTHPSRVTGIQQNRIAFPGSPSEPASQHERGSGRTGADAHLLIISDMSLLLEAVSKTLNHEFRIVEGARNFVEAIRIAKAAIPDMVLIDTAVPCGTSGAKWMRREFPHAYIVALSIVETEAEIIAWARAGISGYVPRTTGLSDLADTLKEIRQGEQRCPSHIAAGLLRWIANDRPVVDEDFFAGDLQALTTREHQVAELIAAGLSNKEIARHLEIGLATTKSHVHSLLRKLKLVRRAQVKRSPHAGVGLGLL